VLDEYLPAGSPSNLPSSAPPSHGLGLVFASKRYEALGDASFEWTKALTADAKAR
jgi:hypothetical protein